MKQVFLKLRGIASNVAGEVSGNTVLIHGNPYEIAHVPVDVPIQGTIYGTLLNFKGTYERLAPKMRQKPYVTPPEVPVLYVKPKNTWISDTRPIPMPKGHTMLEVGATLGIVIGRTATKVKEVDALHYILGYTVVNDVSIPHENVHRPAVKERARDGFCPIGPWIVMRDSIENPNDLTIKVKVNGEIRQENTTANTIRSVEKLISDVTAFMTLYEGDVLLLGVPENAPLVCKNDVVQVEIDQVGAIENPVIKEEIIGLEGL